MTENTLPSNLLIIPQTMSGMLAALDERGIRSGHFTNGVYSFKQELVVPTALSGFQHGIDQEDHPDIPLIIAVNSDISMSGIMDAKLRKAPPEKKEAIDLEKQLLEKQFVRAQKVAIPVALQNPERQVAVLFYDQETPNDFFRFLFGSRVRLETLFKFGYGTDPNAGVIEGAGLFGRVFAHPLPNDIKPVCDDITRRTGQEGIVSIVDLRVVLGKHGKPYISPDNECLFPLRDATLSVYGPRSNPSQQPVDPKYRL